MSDGSSDDEVEMELVMPFVVTASHGGPYDDASFVAGYRLGLLAAELPAINHFGPTELWVTVESELVPQVDLLAMKHGYHADASIEPGVAVEGWATVHLTKGIGPE